MDLLATLGRTLGFSLAAGVNLYATVAILGLAAKYGWVALPEQFQSFNNDYIIIAAIVMYAIEFFADKIPYFDSLWDAIHTAIRPIGGAVIAVTTLGEASPGMKAMAALLGGTVAASSHLTKTSTRAAAPPREPEHEPKNREFRRVNSGPVAKLPRYPGLELIFFLQARRDRFGFATTGVLTDAHPEHARGTPRWRRDERGITFAGQPCGDRFRFTPIVDCRHLDDESIARGFTRGGCRGRCGIRISRWRDPFRRFFLGDRRFPNNHWRTLRESRIPSRRSRLQPLFNRFLSLEAAWVRERLLRGDRRIACDRRGGRQRHSGGRA
jgi:Domain of unknown function (DUF4126)